MANIDQGSASRVAATTQQSVSGPSSTAPKVSADTQAKCPGLSGMQPSREGPGIWGLVTSTYEQMKTNYSASTARTWDTPQEHLGSVQEDGVLPSWSAATGANPALGLPSPDTVSLAKDTMNVVTTSTQMAKQVENSRNVLGAAADVYNYVMERSPGKPPVEGDREQAPYTEYVSKLLDAYHDDGSNMAPDRGMVNERDREVSMVAAHTTFDEVSANEKKAAYELLKTTLGLLPQADVVLNDPRMARLLGFDTSKLAHHFGLEKIPVLKFPVAAYELAAEVTRPEHGTAAKELHRAQKELKSFDSLNSHKKELSPKGVAERERLEKNIDDKLKQFHKLQGDKMATMFNVVCDVTGFSDIATGAKLINMYSGPTPYADSVRLWEKSPVNDL